MKNQIPDFFYIQMIETLKEMEKEGLVKLQDGTVKILDRSGLEDLADECENLEDTLFSMYPKQ